jgi:CheY-like chemotaxis protein
MYLVNRQRLGCIDIPVDLLRGYGVQGILLARKAVIKIMKKVLLVEDDPYIYRLYQNVFTLEGFEIKVAEDGKKALEEVPTFQPDIVLLDVMMKNMNGIEVLTQLKADPTTSNIPVLMLTNMTDMHTAQMAVEKGALQVVIKSEKEPADVVAIVKDALGYTEAPA